MQQLCEAVARSQRVQARGSNGSSASFLAAAVARRLGRPVLLVVGHLDDADEAVDELTSAGVVAARFPALELMPGETHVSVELFGERISLVKQMIAGTPPEVLLCPIQALMQGVPEPSTLETLSLTLKVGDERAPGAVVRWLEQAGYERLDAVEEPGDFAVRGGIIDIFPPGAGTPLGGPALRGGALTDTQSATPGVPVRLDFFGDTLERITEIDVATMASDRAVKSVELVSASLDRVQSDTHTVNFLRLVPKEAVAILHETLEVHEQARGYFERVSDSRGISGPPAVLKLLQERFALVELNQFSGAPSAGDLSIDLPAQQLPELSRDAGEAVRELGQTAAGGTRVAVFCQNGGELQRLGELLDEFAPGTRSAIEARVAYVHRGFIWGGSDGGESDGATERRSDGGGGEEGHGRGKASAAEASAAFSPSSLRRSVASSLPPTAIVPYHELLHRFETRRRTRAPGGGGKLRAGRAMDTFLDFAHGDYVVHREHGIARFVGLRVMQPRDVASPTAEVERRLPGKRIPKNKDKARDEHWGLEEYVTLEFAKGARLHVPATKIDQVQKYVGGFRGKPQLSALGGERWQRQKQNVSDSVRDLASELLRVRAAREHLPGIRYPADTAWQKEFEAEFPYEETEDQLAALVEIKRDMGSERPMDRLICGDVGYGKTELAIRAAFKAVEYGKQVAVLVPTTVLAEQHERTFRSRFADYPFRVESLSRFKTTKEVNDTLAAVRRGQVDVVIGTHRLLSRDVKFADLGLVVIDEEQRFGVEHKEKLLSLRLTVDILTLSATPIPRTLHMSMLGLRDISSLTTAPMDRRAVVTEVIPYNKKRIEQAIARELARDGQIFFVHNRVYNIKSVADDVLKLAPEAEVVIGHGQMPDGELEDVMLRFMRRDADILVSTTIIESGIDIPTANTMFINDADRFGLSELHQLRGRVGRYKHRAYCYLLLPQNRTVGQTAVKRLKAIEEFSMLGAGFKIAMRDLEIRGAGNILGPEQSGHISAVGYEMYCQLLDRAVKELKGELVAAPSETAIELGITGLIPKAYIPSDLRRMEAYRRISTAAAAEQIRQVAAELAQAYGPPPPPVDRLLQLAELRIGLCQLEVRNITVRDKDIVLRVPPGRAEEVGGRLRQAKGSVVALPPKTGEHSSEIYYRPPENYLDPATLLNVLRQHLGAQAVGAPGGAGAPVAVGMAR